MRKIDAGMLMIFRQRRPASLQGHKNVHLPYPRSNKPRVKMFFGTSNEG